MNRLPGQLRPPRIAPLVALLAGLFVISGMTGPVLGAAGWTFTLAPGTIKAGVATDVRLTVTNATSDGGTGNDIGCIKVSIPSEFTVRAAAIESVDGGHAWSVSFAGGSGTTVTASANSDTDRLLGGTARESIVIRVRVSSTDAGAHDWTATQNSKATCALPFKTALTRSVTVISPTPAPTPRPTPVPTPRPTPTQPPGATPRPTPTPTPRPTPTQPPGATPRPTPRPTPAPTLRPTLTRPPGAAPAPTPTQPPGATAAPPPAPSPPPAAAPAPTVLPGPVVLPSARPTPTPSPAPAQAPGFTLGGTMGGGSVNFDGASLGFAGQLFAWVVPGLLLTVPGLIVIVAVLFQILGGAAWLPVVRRRLGGGEPGIKATGKGR